jgi:hypothetical protein
MFYSQGRRERDLTTKYTKRHKGKNGKWEIGKLGNWRSGKREGESSRTKNETREEISPFCRRGQAPQTKRHNKRRKRSVPG